MDQDTNDNDDGFEFHPEDRDELVVRSDDGVDDALGDTVWLNLTKSVSIVGLLHIIHNATDGLELSLSHYSQWLHQVKHAARLLRRRYSRERMLEQWGVRRCEHAAYLFMTGDRGVSAHWQPDPPPPARAG